MTDKEMTYQKKQEVRQQGEATRAGRQFVPAVDIFENSTAVTVLADMPGVAKEAVDISLDDGVLTLKGTMRPVEQQGNTILLQEYESGHYIRRFTISEAIDQEKISASMANGVLKLVLPKTQPAKPRKIAVQTS